MSSPQHILAEAERSQFRLAGTGLFSQVVWVVNTDIALKIPDEPGEADAVEKRIYERLGNHPFILQTFGEAESIAGKGLALRYLPAGTLARNLELMNFPVERTQWPSQAAEAVRYIHSKGVIHCDIGAHNFLIQSNGSIVLADFCGSILDGSTAIVATSARYSRPFADQALNQTEKDDIFALGTVIYEICAGHRLYPEKSDREVCELFQKGAFPDTSHLARNLQTVIEKCWRDQYRSSGEIKSDLDRAIVPLFWPSNHPISYTFVRGFNSTYNWKEDFPTRWFMEGGLEI